jgi:predicted nuclease with TOPRIM domain|tara:strand:- start:1707 stop:2105 length:399 start_codon:yes stop_codon:yes gene_type:complete
MWQLVIGSGILMLVLVGGFKSYYDKAEAQKRELQTKLELAIDNQELLEKNIADQNQQLLEQKEKHKIVLERVSALTVENQKALEEVEEIRKKFAKHDMDVLSLRKPKLIENIINRGTKQVLNELETITAPTT